MRTLLLSMVLVLVAPAAWGQSFLGKREAAWLSELQEGQGKERRSAAFALGKLGPISNNALTALIAALKDNDAAVRDAAAYALGEIAEARDAERVWQRAGKELLSRLNDDNARVRRSAAYALGSCKAGRDAEEALLKALSDRQPTVRRSAAWALGKSGTSVSSTTARGLIDALKGENDPLVLRDVAGALGALGRPLASDAADPLAQLMQNQSDIVVRKTALSSLLSLMGPEMAKASAGTHDRLVSALRDALKTGDGEMKGLVAGALDQLGDHAAPALQDLATIARDKTLPPATRRNAVVALTKMWPTIRRMSPEEAAGIVRALANVLDPEQPVEVRQYIAEALSRIGFPHVAPATDALLDAISKDSNEMVRHRSVWAFLNCDDLAGRDRAVSVLRKALKDSHKGTRYDAARCLAHGLNEKAGEDVIDTLDEMLHDPSIKIYNQTNTNVKGGSESSSGTSSVNADLGGDARFMAAQALGFIGPPARRAKIIKTLKEMTTSKNELSREHATKALQKIGE
jgi:HEAT repeat protein